MSPGGDERNGPSTGVGESIAIHLFFLGGGRRAGPTTARCTRPHGGPHGGSDRSRGIISPPPSTWGPALQTDRNVLTGARGPPPGDITSPRRDKALRGAGRRIEREKESGERGRRSRNARHASARNCGMRPSHRGKAGGAIAGIERGCEGRREISHLERAFRGQTEAGERERERGQRFITGIERSLCHGKKEREREEGDSRGDCGRDPRCGIGSCRVKKIPSRDACGR